MIPTLRELRTRIDELGADIDIFESRRRRRQALIHAAVLVLALAAVTVLVSLYAPALTDAERLREVIGGLGRYGPAALVGLQALQVVLAPIPGQVLAVVAGYLYGAWWGTLYNMLGVTIGSAAAFWLSRRYGRPYVERVVDDDVIDRFDSVADTRARGGLFVVFLVPGLPDDAICFVGGLTTLPLWQLVTIAVIGRAPGFFLVNVVGESFQAGQVGLALGLGALVVALSVVGYYYRETLITLFDT